MDVAVRQFGLQIALALYEGRRTQIEKEKWNDQDSEAGGKGKDARRKEAREEDHAGGSLRRQEVSVGPHFLAGFQPEDFIYRVLRCFLFQRLMALTFF